MPEISEAELKRLREDSVWRDNATATLLKVGNEGECKLCHQPLIWLVTKNGKNFPFSEAGLPHFKDCPERDESKPAPPPAPVDRGPPQIPDDDIPF